MASNKCYATDFWVKVRKRMNLFHQLHSTAPLVRIETRAVKIHPQYDLLHSYCSELDFKLSLNTAHTSLTNFPARIVDDSG